MFHITIFLSYRRFPPGKTEKNIRKLTLITCLPAGRLNTDHWSLVTGHWSLVTGHWSLITGHWSLVTGHWSLITAFAIMPGLDIFVTT
jgi:hypothetical protein